MKARILLLFAAAFFLTSCGNLGYIMSTYKGKPVTHETKDLSVRIFDRPDLNKMMVTPGMGRAMGIGAASGATFGLYSPGLDPLPYQQAAQNWLDVNNRKSEIISSRLLIKPQWEMAYRRK